MTAKDISEIIAGIPYYITYIYPGYLTMYTYFFLRGKTLKDTSYIFIKVIAISYVYLGILEWIKKLDFTWLPLPIQLKQDMALITISLLVAYLAYRIVRSKKIIKFLDSLQINTTFYENEIDVLSDFDQGAWLCVYLKDDNVIYEGSLGYKELDEDRRQYICLDSYYKYYLDKQGKPKEPYIEDYGNNPNESVLIFYDSIKRIEKRCVITEGEKE